MIHTLVNTVICYIYKAMVEWLRSGLLMLSGLNAPRNCEENELRNILWDFLVVVWLVLGGATANFPRRSFKMCDIPSSVPHGGS